MNSILDIARRGNWAHVLRNALPNRSHSNATLLYMASTYDCGPCPLKPQCCAKSPQRKVPRDVNDEARDVARALAKTEAYTQTRRDRKKVEMLFAHLKRILRLSRLRLRGPRGAQFEVHARGNCPEPEATCKTGGPSTADGVHRVRCVSVAFSP